MAAVARNRFSAEYGDAVDAAHAHYRREYYVYCLVIFSVKIHVKLSHRLAICRENVQ